MSSKMKWVWDFKWSYSHDKERAKELSWTGRKGKKLSEQSQWHLPRIVSFHISHICHLNFPILYTYIKFNREVDDWLIDDR